MLVLMKSEKTEVVTGSDAVLRIATRFLKSVRKKLDVCTATLSWNQSLPLNEISQIYLDVSKRGGKLRLVSNVTNENVEYCKELMKIVEIRHRADVSIYFGVSESEFVAVPGSGEFNSNGTILHSNEQPFVKYQQAQFDMLWDNALPAHLRVRELEMGRPHVETKIISGEENVLRVVNQFLSRAASTGPQAFAYGVSDMRSSNRAAEGYNEILNELFKRHQEFEILLVTDIQKENSKKIKNLMSERYKIKHIEGNNIRFSVSKEEYIETIASKTPGGIPEQIMWSNDPQIIGQGTRMFNALWSQARPAQNRIKELETNEPAPITRLVQDPEETKSVYREMVEEATNEILLLLPTTSAFHRHEKAGLIDSVVGSANRGLTVKIFTPLDDVIGKTYRISNDLEDTDNSRLTYERASGIRSRNLESSLVSIVPIPSAKAREGVSTLITDKSSSLVIEEKGETQGDFITGTGLSTYSTSSVTVRSNIRFIERVLESMDIVQSKEKALRQERISRRQAELMQDILTHDIRNYNQITRANVELLQQRLEDDRLKQLANSAILAIDGSTRLIQNARLLSGILADQDWKLYPVNLGESLEKSLSLVRSLYQNKKVEVTPAVFPNSLVLADSMLDEVFVNILSNAVKYTESSNVPLQIELGRKEADFQDGSGKRQYWEVTIIDRGRGIPEELKSRVALRYQGSEKVRGLGLSIAHGLVVHRYSGRFELRNRIESDYSKGTKVELWLQSV